MPTHRTARRPALLRIAVALCLAAVGPAAGAADADLDPGFSVTGRYTAAFDLGGDRADVAARVLRAPNGELLLIGSAATATVEQRLAIVRLNAEGNETTRATYAYNLRTIGPATLDPSRQTIATGTVVGNDGGVDTAAVRIRVDGAADLAFANLGTARLDVSPFQVEVPLDVQARADGGSFVLVEAFNLGDPVMQPVLFDLSPGGAQDTAATAAVAVASGGIRGSGALALDASGRLLVATSQRVAGGACDLVVARLQPGSTTAYDPTFGVQGIARLRLPGTQTCLEVRDLELQTDGRLLVAGNLLDTAPFNLGLVVRLTASGTSDPSFAGGGQVGVGLFGAATTLTDIALQSDGRIVVAGSGRSGDGSLTQQLVMRVLGNGTLDTGFASDGYFAGFVFPAQGGGNSNANIGNAVLVDAQDRIVLTGSRAWSLSDTDFTALRLLGSPRLFGDGFE
jgi:uncharacterized delta-60 repeat protein